MTSPLDRLLTSGRDRTVPTERAVNTAVGCLALIAALVLGLLGGALYIGLHFLGKVW